jgi:hypothetical protein
MAREVPSILENVHDRDRASAPASLSWLDLLYGAALMFFIGTAAWTLVDHGLLLSRTTVFPFPFSYAEGLEIDRALQWPNLQALYPTTLLAPPLRISPQPPLYTALTALLLPNEPAIAPFLQARMLSLAGYLVAGLATAGAVYGFARSVGASIVAAALLWLSPQIQYASAVATPDAAGLALALLGLALVALFGRSQRRIFAIAMIVAAAVFLAALAVQPVFVAPPLLAAVAWLLTHRRRSAAVALIGGVAGAAIAGALALQSATNGGFLLHVLDYGVREWSRLDAMRLMLNQMLRSGLIFVPCILFFITEPLGARHIAARTTLAILALAFVLTIVDSRYGATWATTLSLSAATSIGFGVVVAWLRPLRWMAVLALVFGMLQIDTYRDWRDEEFAPPFTRKLNITRELTQLETMLLQAQDPVLMDEHIALLSLADRQPTLYPLEMNVLHQRGIWSTADLIAAIDRKEFSLIAWYEPIDRNDKFIMTRWPEEVRKAVYRNYFDSGYLAYTVLYRPKP